MRRPLGFAPISILLTAALVAGCRPKPSAGSAKPSAYFRTRFQTESQFIVETIVSDLAEQLFYAKFHALPDTNHFSVAAVEKPRSPQDAPVYELRIRLDPKLSDVRLDLNVNGPIWSPAIYETVASELSRAVGLRPGHPSRWEDTSLLSRLTDGTAETIETEDESLSSALESDFANPLLHEKAALLLGAFALREHSGHFFDIRLPLCRMTAHLALARFLNGSPAYGINGRMAEAILLTLIGDEVSALKQLNTIGSTNNAAVMAFVRALQTRNTGDYRILGRMDGLTRVESVEWFSAMAGNVGVPQAWSKLSDVQRQTVDFVRAANQEDYSVEIGHELLSTSIPLELRQIESIYSLTHQHPLARSDLVKALNALPEHGFSTGPDGTIDVRVIDWGLWAMFLQRQLCHAIQQNFYFMNFKWGVPAQAREFAARCAQEFGALRLYPFVRRFDCTDVAAYHQSVDEGLKLVVAAPQLVPADCWNWLYYSVNFAPRYVPNPDSHISKWFNHNPPPGTVYDLMPRLNHRSLVDRPDVIALLETLHTRAPYDCRIANYVVKKEMNERPTYDQAMALYRDVLPYSVTAQRTLANTVKDQPARYEKLMRQAAKLNPVCYYVLGDYFMDRRQEDKAARYIDQACAADPDSVRVSNYALWRVRYYLKEGQKSKARRIAEEAGEVYSEVGLEAAAVFFETTSNFDEAFRWYSRVNERYSNPVPLLHFCARYKALTGDTRFDPEVHTYIRRLFPKGIERVSLADFHSRPADGVLIKQENDRVRSAGLKAGDVIVAVYGVRVHNYQQYSYGRELKDTPELDLIVWQGDAYREFTPSPPHHLFGVAFGDYPAP